MRRPLPLVPLFLGLALTACPEFDDPGARPTLGPIAVGAQLVTADQRAHELVVVTTDGGRADAIARIALDGEPTHLAALPSARGLLVLERDDERVELVSLPDGDRRAFDLGAPFEGLALSPDSLSAIAFYPPGTATSVFHNTNEIAYIDLRPEVPAEEAVVRRTLASLGGAPLAVLPSPLVGDRRFAFVLSAEHVAILDLTAPTVRERSVPLVSLNTGGERTPSALRFALDTSGDAPALWAIITTVEGNAVYALHVFDSVPTELGEPDFDVRLTQLAGYTSGGDVALASLPDGRLVAVLLSPAQGTATVTTLANGASLAVELDLGVNRLATYTEADRPIAVIYRSGGTAFHILDIAALEEKKDKAFRTRYANRAIHSLLPVPSEPLFFAFHGGTEEAVSVINADTDRVTSFGRTGYVVAAQLSEPLERLFLITRVGTDDFVVSVNTATLHATASQIPGGAAHLFVLPEAATVATSADVLGGQLTLWPADQIDDEAAYAVPAYLLDGLLDRAANR